MSLRRHPPNVAVTRLIPQPAEPVAGQDVTLLAGVRNFSAEPVRTQVTLDADGARQSQPIDLPAWGDGECAFVIRAAAAGPLPIGAEVEADGFPADDARHSVVQVRDFLRLALDRPRRIRPTRRILGKLAAALPWLEIRRFIPAPGRRTSASFPPGPETSRRRPPEIRARPAPRSSSARRRPARSPPSAHCSPRPPIPRPARSPSMPRPPAGPPFPTRTIRANQLFRSGDFGNPFAGTFRERLRLPASLAAAPGIRPIALYADGVPALLECPTDGAPILLWNLPLDPAKTDWPLQGSFLPAIAEILLRTRPHGGAEPAYSLPGSPLSWSSTDPAQAGAVTLSARPPSRWKLTESTTPDGTLWQSKRPGHARPLPLADLRPGRRLHRRQFPRFRIRPPPARCRPRVRRNRHLPAARSPARPRSPKASRSGPGSPSPPCFCLLAESLVHSRAPLSQHDHRSTIICESFEPSISNPFLIPARGRRLWPSPAFGAWRGSAGAAPAARGTLARPASCSPSPPSLPCSSIPENGSIPAKPSQPVGRSRRCLVLHGPAHRRRLHPRRRRRRAHPTSRRPREIRRHSAAHPSVLRETRRRPPRRSPASGRRRVQHHSRRFPSPPGRRRRRRSRSPASSCSAMAAKPSTRLPGRSRRPRPPRPQPQHRRPHRRHRRRYSAAGPRAHPAARLAHRLRRPAAAHPLRPQVHRPRTRSARSSPCAMPTARNSPASPSKSPPGKTVAAAFEVKAPPASTHWTIETPVIAGEVRSSNNQPAPQHPRPRIQNPRLPRRGRALLGQQVPRPAPPPATPHGRPLDPPALRRTLLPHRFRQQRKPRNQRTRSSPTPSRNSPATTSSSSGKTSIRSSLPSAPRCSAPTSATTAARCFSPAANPPPPRCPRSNRWSRSSGPPPAPRISASRPTAMARPPGSSARRCPRPTPRSGPRCPPSRTAARSPWSNPSPACSRTAFPTSAAARSPAASGKFPALLVRRYGQGVTGLVNGDGLWKWDFFPEARELGNCYEDFWTQLIQWMASYSEFLPGQDFSLRLPASRGEVGHHPRRHHLLPRPRPRSRSRSSSSPTPPAPPTKSAPPPSPTLPAARSGAPPSPRTNPASGTSKLIDPRPDAAGHSRVLCHRPRPARGNRRPLARSRVSQHPSPHATGGQAIQAAGFPDLLEIPTRQKSRPSPANPAPSGNPRGTPPSSPSASPPLRNRVVPPPPQRASHKRQLRHEHPFHRQLRRIRLLLRRDALARRAGSACVALAAALWLLFGLADAFAAFESPARVAITRVLLAIVCGIACSSPSSARAACLAPQAPPPAPTPRSPTPARPPPPRFRSIRPRPHAARAAAHRTRAGIRRRHARRASGEQIIPWRFLRARASRAGHSAVGDRRSCVSPSPPRSPRSRHGCSTRQRTSRPTARSFSPSIPPNPPPSMAAKC